MSAVVLGVGPGLGMALARAYADTGRRVALIARNADRLEGYAAQIPSSVAIPADLADPVQVGAAIDQAAGSVGPIDVVHFNASLLVSGAPSEVPLDAVEQSWRVGCLGAWAALQSAVPLLPVGGAFFVTGGGLALDPWPPASALASAKAAVRNLVQAAAKELPHLHVCMVTVRGVIDDDGDLSAQRIAARFVDLLGDPDPPVEVLLPE
jgi:NAD(P)-dependent dehydrogenase (short-subunit alcohol dehydrogenase family)